MSAHLGLYTRVGGPLLSDDTGRLTKLIVSTNSHGYESCQLAAPMPLPDAFRRYDWPGVPYTLVRIDGTIAFEGRAEDVTIRTDGVDITAFGYSRALSDTTYTALWSTTDYRLWHPTTQTEIASRTPDKFNMSNDGRLYISTKKGQTYGNGTDVCSFTLKAPYGGRQIVGFSLDYTVNLPTAGGANTWEFGYVTYNEGFTGAGVVPITGTNGTTFSRTVNYVVTACDYLELYIYNNTGAPSTPAGEDGANFLQIRNLRVVTTTANRVNTTLGTTFGAGGPQTVTPPSMSNIYVGQQLQIKHNASNSTTVAVTAITATTFTATFPGPYNAADSVNAHVIYADEIVKAMRAAVSALNSDQIAASDVLIQSPRIDLWNVIYQDEIPSAILDRLITQGNDVSVPHQWGWGVGDNRQLFFRPEGTNARTWYVDISVLDLQRTIEQLHNSAYAVYQDAASRAIRTAVATDAESVSRYGLTRRQSVAADTTSATQATVHRDTVLNDNANPAPRFTLTFDQVFTASGAVAPIWLPKVGDVMVIRNLSPTISVDIDGIRTFRIARTVCDLVARSLTVEPAVPTPSVQALLARALKGKTT